jgi:hypothetical protein
MRRNTQSDLKRILHNFDQKKFDRIKVAYLLMKLRYITTSGSVKDMAHFIAHEQREEGKSHKLAMRFLSINRKILLTPLDQPVKIGVTTDRLIEQSTFVREIEDALKSIHFPYNFGQKAFSFFCSVLENIAGATMFLEEKDSLHYSKMVLSPIEVDQDGRRTIYVELYPRDINTGKVRLGEGSSFQYVFLQALPDKIEPSNHLKLLVV